MTVSRRGMIASGLSATACLAASVPAARAASPGCQAAAMVRTGFERLRENGYRMLAGGRVGVIANPTSVDHAQRHIVDVMHADRAVQLRAVFGPEHGFRGSAQAGHSEPRTIDLRTGVPVYDIYAAGPAAMDAALREADVDIVVFDIQDVGARFYTYIWTLFDAMASAARLNKRFMVLDRPNPITGRDCDGPLLSPRFASFVGREPIPIVHGMTVGELAGLFNAVFLPHPDVAGRRVELEVVTMTGWKRDLFQDQTDLPWVPPSPNMPTLDTAMAYPGTCLFEGTSLSVGRGTTSPFLLLGGPTIDGPRWRAAIEAAQLPGVLLRDAFFTPMFSVDAGALSQGVQLVIGDRNRFQPLRTAIEMLRTARGAGAGMLWPDGGAKFDRLAGQDLLRRAIAAGTPTDDIIASWSPDLSRFRALRREFLLYGRTP